MHSKYFKVQFGPSSKRFKHFLFCSNAGLDFRSGSAIRRTLDRTSVQFGKVQVRTEVQNRTTASLCRKRFYIILLCIEKSSNLGDRQSVHRSHPMQSKGR